MASARNVEVSKLINKKNKFQIKIKKTFKNFFLIL